MVTIKHRMLSESQYKMQKNCSKGSMLLLMNKFILITLFINLLKHKKMKKNLILTGAFVAMMCFFGMSNVNAQEEVEIKEYCPIEQFQDGNALHGRGIGDSRDQQMAREIARDEARSELAGNIMLNLKSLTQKYKGQTKHNDDEEFIRVVKNMSQQIVDQNISNLKTVCEKGVTYKNSKGVKMYKYYHVVEYDKEKIEKAAYDGLKKEGVLKANEDFNNFKKEFEGVFKDQPEGEQ